MKLEPVAASKLKAGFEVESRRLTCYDLAGDGLFLRFRKIEVACRSREAPWKASMTRYLYAALLLVVVPLFVIQQSPVSAQERFSMDVVTTGLEYPWEVTWGPDGYLWVTERTAGRVVRIDPDDGTQQVAVTIPEVFQSIPQDGLLGLALHPGLLDGTALVYVAFTYQDGPDARLKLRRFSYTAETGVLDDPVDIVVGLPAHDDHLGGRLVIGPDEKLYLTIGDQGGNWLQNFCNPNLAQELPTAAEVRAEDWTQYEGKILRLNLDGSIPSDNPRLGGVQSHILSYGHRNPQGLAFGSEGLLYASEHGPSTDDELNLVESGRNYGWPHVAGYVDDQAYVYGNWSASRPTACSALAFDTNAIPDSVPQQSEGLWNHPDFRPPLQTLFTVSNDYDFETQGGVTIAPSSLDIYIAREGGIAEWGDSLLVPGMIKGRMYRQPLARDGRSAMGDPVELFRTVNRYRDLAIHPDGRTIYIATDTGGRTTGLSGTMTDELAHPGAILRFTYTGP